MKCCYDTTYDVESNKMGNIIPTDLNSILVKKNELNELNELHELNESKKIDKMEKGILYKKFTELNCRIISSDKISNKANNSETQKSHNYNYHFDESYILSIY